MNNEQKSMEALIESGELTQGKECYVISGGKRKKKILIGTVKLHKRTGTFGDKKITQHKLEITKSAEMKKILKEKNI